MGPCTKHLQQCLVPSNTLQWANSRVTILIVQMGSDHKILNPLGQKLPPHTHPQDAVSMDSASLPFPILLREQGQAKQALVGMHGGLPTT